MVDFGVGQRGARLDGTINRYPLEDHGVTWVECKESLYVFFGTRAMHFHSTTVQFQFSDAAL